MKGNSSIHKHSPIVKHVLDKENPEYIKMTDDESYWRMFCELWATCEDRCYYH